MSSNYHTISEQILNFNNNIVDILSNLNSLVTSSESTITFNITDNSGIIQKFTLPSFGYLNNEIVRLNNNLNQMYSINDAGALIQPSDGTKFKKVVTVDLNREPNDISTLNLISNFVAQKNWIFDGLLNPELFIEVDLSGKVEDNVRKVLSRRYIPEFEKDAAGNFTSLGNSALNSFNTNFKDKNGFTLAEYETWHQTTVGVVNPLSPNYDEQMFDMDPNYLQLDGMFSVQSIKEDLLNKKLFYMINKLTYTKRVITKGVIEDTTDTLKVGDELIINTPQSSTRYKILEISTTQANPMIRVERVEGLEPIPVGTDTLKIYSPVIYNKIVRISVGYDERNVVFIKPMNMDNYIMSKNWSGGIGYYTNDLKDLDTNLIMEQYYSSYVNDYGQVLKDLVSKKISPTNGSVPTSPTLDANNFKVVQINKHLTDTTDSNQLKNLSNQQKSLKSEITQIDESIRTKTSQIKNFNFSSDGARKQIQNDLDTIQKTRDSKSKLLTSVTSQILDISKSPVTNEDPKFAVRGFWEIPQPAIVRGSRPQEVVQFRIQYRYLSKDGKESTIEPFKLKQLSTNAIKTAAFSNWTEIKTDARKRILDKKTGSYYWEVQDVSNADIPNINQLDIPIKPNEKVEIKISSISEVGWPESPLESPFSDSITIEFPNSLNNVINENSFIIKDADKEDIKVSVKSEYTSRGLDDHLNDQTTVNGVTFFHSADKILSGFKDNNGIVQDMFSYLQYLESRVKSLEEIIKKVKGELEVVIYRNNNQFIVKNGSSLNFNIELEDYLEQYTGVGVPTGRVYSNNIYVIKDFLVKVRNKSIDSPLGLLSSRLYNSSSNSDVYNYSAPQIFWVDQQNQLIISNSTLSTKTQIDNQFIWSVNYDNIDQTSVVKLSQNVTNNFTSNNSNSLTDILSSDQFNLGYSENSILTFVGNNLSLFDSSKWIEMSLPTISSTTKLLTTIHPQVQSLSSIQETNLDKVKSILGGEQNDINIPINIYFKMNSLDPTQTDLGYHYVNLNQSNVSVKHTKKLKFLLENQSENRPFIFTISFVMNRSKTIIKKSIESTPTSLISEK